MWRGAVLVARDVFANAKGECLKGKRRRKSAKEGTATFFKVRKEGEVS